MNVKWEKGFEDFKKFYIKHERLPVVNGAKLSPSYNKGSKEYEIGSWYRVQGSRFKSGTISDEQIMDGIRILNEDYSKTNPEFPNPPRDLFTTIAGNPNLKFCLATSDPNGNPTTGITRTASSVNNFDYLRKMKIEYRLFFHNLVEIYAISNIP